MGGLFALWVGGRQTKRDRVAAQTDRSHQAAMSIAQEIAALEEAIVVWKAAAERATHAGAIDVGNVQRVAAIGQSMTDATRTASEMRAAFNGFSRSATVQRIGLTDSDLRTRVRNHMRLAGLLCVVAEQGGTVGVQLSETVRRHADAVLDAIDAHVNGQQLPSYTPLPKLEASKAQELVDWKP